jgi:hypothetical protein
MILHRTIMFRYWFRRGRIRHTGVLRSGDFGCWPPHHNNIGTISWYNFYSNGSVVGKCTNRDKSDIQQDESSLHTRRADEEAQSSSTMSLRWRKSTSIVIQLLAAKAFKTSPLPPAAAAVSRLANTCSTMSTTAMHASAATIESENPLLRSWANQPFHLPPFESITTSHFEPALEAAMESHILDLEAIASSTSADFDSILGAYDRAGALLSKVSAVYSNYVSSLNTPDMQIVQTKMAPILSRHNSKCYNIPGLFAKIEMLHDMKDEMLAKGEWNAEQARLAERVYIGFVRMGAKLNDDEKKEYADIKGEMILVIEAHVHDMCARVI